MRILKYRADLRSLLFLGAALGLLTGSLSLRLTQFSVPTYIATWTLGVWSVFLICLINHNHQHHPIFYSPFLNRITDILISLCIGAPSTRLHLVHHFNHHRHYQGENDWSSYKAHAKGKGLFRAIYYFVSTSKEIAKNRNNIDAPLSLKTQQTTERVALWAFAIGAFYINPGIFFALILPSWICGLALLLT